MQTIYPYRHKVPEDALFFRSNATGQIYAMDGYPPFPAGFTQVTRAEYETYVREHYLR